MISLKHISLRTAVGTALEDISLEILPGECMAVIGSSGSGKTLLMELLMGERRATIGSVTVDGVPLEKLTPDLLQLYRRSLGILLQRNQLLADRSIAANIALSLEAHNVSDEEMMKRIMMLLEQIELTEKLAMPPETLNIGEKRRVALAQAVASSPMILLADEPFGNDIDEDSARIILSLLKETCDRGATVIIATRNPLSIASLSPKMTRLERGRMVEQPKTHMPNSMAHCIISPSPL